MNLQDIDISSYVEQLDDKKQCSQLGFFSKPYMVDMDNTEVIVKRYHPLKKNVSFILESHDKYVNDLKKLGIKVPETRMVCVQKGAKQELVVLQNAFKEEELVRSIFQKKPLEELLKIMELLYNETVNFWINNTNKENLGFHPTLRNYAIKDDELFYFDTVPPMNMQQNELNKLIIQMARSEERRVGKECRSRWSPYH